MKKTLELTLLAVVTLAGCAHAPVQDTQQVAAKSATAPLPFVDPLSPLWQQATEHPAAMLVQNLTEPKLLDPGVTVVKVRALHNRDWVVFRLEWDDPTHDLIPRSGRSSDAAAVQFPFAPGEDVPDAAMGEKGKGVRIWYWKAVWQDDAERAQAGQGDRIATLYPNAAQDHYPYQAPRDPATRALMEKRYAPARAAGNPIAIGANGAPVQVLMAEGFGATTVSSTQPARGRGQWAGGKWITTIARPLRGGAELGDLNVGMRTAVAFAVWDGEKAHTGSRKMRSAWIPFVLEEQ